MLEFSIGIRILYIYRLLLLLYFMIFSFLDLQARSVGMIWLALKKYKLKIKGGQIKKQFDGLPWAFIQKYLGSGLHPMHPGLFPLSQSSFPARIPSPHFA